MALLRAAVLLSHEGGVQVSSTRVVNPLKRGVGRRGVGSRRRGAALEDARVKVDLDFRPRHRAELPRVPNDLKSEKELARDPPNGV